MQLGGLKAEQGGEQEHRWDYTFGEAILMAMAQAVLAGRGLHLRSSFSAWPLSSVRHLPASGSSSQASFSRGSYESRRYVHLIKASGASEKNGKPKSRLETRLLSTIVPILPILATIVVTKSTDTYYRDSVFVDIRNDWMMPEEMTKNLYMVFSMVFCWGCCVFGSMADPFYESDEYRGAGGNGTNHWIYERAEAEEQEAREELFREALVKEIEGKVGEMRELEQGADKEKELV